MNLQKRLLTLLINILFLFTVINYAKSINNQHKKSDIISMKPDQSLNCPNINYHGSKQAYIYSPNFPGNYDNNSNCTYVFNGSDDGYLTLTFFVFETEYEWDVVSIYDGIVDENNNYTLLDAISGNLTLPNKVYNATSNTMTVIFSTDRFTSDIGFYAEFLSSTDPTTLACPDNEYTDDFGVIVSPHFPREYPKSANCSYKIGNGSPNTYVKLTIHYFETEGIYDILDIYDGESSNDDLLIELSGEIFEGTSYTTKGPYAYAIFTTDLFNQCPGFSIIYQIIEINNTTTPLNPINLLPNNHPLNEKN